MSEWQPVIVRLGDIRKHDQADTLGITTIHSGYDCIVKLGEFQPGDLAAYIPVDTDVDTKRPEFEFLRAKARANGRYRIRAMKLRGVFSLGLLLKPPPGQWSEGDSVVDAFALTKYLPRAEREPTQGTTHRKTRKSETARFDRRVAIISAMFAITSLYVWWPLALVVLAAGYGVIKLNRQLTKKPKWPLYDIESVRKFGDILQPGDIVEVSCKLHGMNASYLHTGRKFYMRSRTTFRGQSGGKGGWPGTGNFDFDDVFAQIAKQYDLERKLKSKPNLVLFGEIVGDKIQDLTYGCGPGEHRFYAFDVYDLKAKKYLDLEEFHSFCDELDIPKVPVFCRGPWNEKMLDYAEGPDPICPKHVREGVVIRTLVERNDPRMGRVQLKLAGQGYLLRKQKEEDDEAAQCS